MTNKLIKNIFSVTNGRRQKHKVITLFGVKFKIPKTIYRWKAFVYFLDSIILKDKKKVVFLSFPDFSDNAREYYEYLKANHADEYKLVWLYDKKRNSDYNYIKEKFFINTFRGIWELVTAKYIVYTGLALNNACNFNKHKLLQLWHGMPLKTLGYNEKNVSPYIFKQYKIFGKNGYFFVSSDIFKLSMIASFLMPPNRIFITGQAKTDCILTDRNKEKIEKLFNISSYKKVIIYAPTYKEAERNKRRDINKEFSNIFYCDDYSEEKFYKMLEDNNILFLMKPHPFDEPFYKKYLEEENLNHPNIKVFFDNDMKENNLYFYDFFKFADLMITDFSSIAIDYLISKKPVIFLNSTEEEYSANRGFILEDNYQILMPGAKVNTFEKLICEINDALTVDSWKQKREEMLPLLYKYFDSNSSKRIYEIMKEL